MTSDEIDQPGTGDEPPEEEDRFGYGRWARSDRAEDKEAFRTLMHHLDTESALTDFDEPPGAYEVFHEVVVRFKWSEIFKYAEGALEQIDSLDNDPVGFCVDAYLEPRYENDITEVVSIETHVDYSEDETVEILRRKREKDEPDVPEPPL